MKFLCKCILSILLLFLLVNLSVNAQTLVAPYTGPSIKGVDTSTLKNKIMCGYQGWFSCEGDGADRGWVHWTKGGGMLSPENARIDLWPDVSEYAPENRYDTEFEHPDGRTAQVFSSYDRGTVLRHFEWMREYGIDGAFVQRFGVEVFGGTVTNHRDTVLAHCREGANLNGRAYAVMYDLSGMRTKNMALIQKDWRRLRDTMKITEDPAYLRHKGKPLVAVWGVGFNDERDYSLEDCKELIEFLKEDGCTVMLGVPTYWREQNRDAIEATNFHEILALADVISPWSVGRFGSPGAAESHGKDVWGPDRLWCETRNIDLLPVVFPGFSWHNMQGATLDEIPRRKGEFLWAQVGAAQNSGAKMIYIAMFDEVDEGTAVFKCTNEPPVSEKATFLTNEGLPSDFYLRLCGIAGRNLRGETEWSAAVPSTLAKELSLTP